MFFGACSSALGLHRRPRSLFSSVRYLGLVELFNQFHNVML